MADMLIALAGLAGTLALIGGFIVGLVYGVNKAMEYHDRKMGR